MTQDQFYTLWPIEYSTKEGRLIRDLRDQGFTWAQLNAMLATMQEGPYSEDWRITVEAAR